MPHISVKMLKGRTDEQKKLAADKVAEALYEAIGCSKESPSPSRTTLPKSGSRSMPMMSQQSRTCFSAKQTTTRKTS